MLEAIIVLHRKNQGCLPPVNPVRLCKGGGNSHQSDVPRLPILYLPALHHVPTLTILTRNHTLCLWNRKGWGAVVVILSMQSIAVYSRFRFWIEKSQNNLHAPGTVVLPESVTYCVFQCS